MSERRPDRKGNWRITKIWITWTKSENEAIECEREREERFEQETKWQKNNNNMTTNVMHSLRIWMNFCILVVRNAFASSLWWCWSNHAYEHTTDSKFNIQTKWNVQQCSRILIIYQQPQPQKKKKKIFMRKYICNSNGINIEHRHKMHASIVHYVCITLALCDKSTVNQVSGLHSV